MRFRSKQINEILKKIELISDEDLKKVNAYLNELKVENDKVRKSLSDISKRLNVQDFSFLKARKLIEKLKSSLADEVVKERAFEQ